MTFLLTLWSKAKLYLVAMAVLLVAVGAALVRARLNGAQSEKLKQLQTKLEVKQLEAKVDADLAAVTAAERRDRLRERWSRR